MKKLCLGAIALVSLLLASCALLPKVTSTEYRKALVIFLTEDEVTLSIANSFFSLPKPESLRLGGIAKAVEERCSQSFKKAGYEAQFSDISASEFWAMAAAEVKPSAFDIIAKSTGVREAVQRLVRDGRITTAGFDAIFVVGPNEHYADVNQLSQKGTLIEVGTLTTKPNLAWASISAATVVFKADSLEVIRAGRGFKTAELGGLGFGSNIHAISNPDKEPLLGASLTKQKNASI